VKTNKDKRIIHEGGKNGENMKTNKDKRIIHERGKKTNKDKENHPCKR